MNTLFMTRTKAASLQSPLFKTAAAISASQRPIAIPPILACQSRWLHAGKNIDPASLVPKPTPFVPDVKTFLSLIGRGLNQHVDKFPSWEALFTLTSPELKELGIDPPRTRKYLIQWRQKFRNGIYGIGGDLKHVDKKGTAELRIYYPPVTEARPFPARIVVNVPKGKSPEEAAPEDVTRVKGYRVEGIRAIKGPHAKPMKGLKPPGARVGVVEGLWEFKRGVKVDGGERRRDMVRFLRRVAERRARREGGR